MLEKWWAQRLMLPLCPSYLLKIFGFCSGKFQARKTWSSTRAWWNLWTSLLPWVSSRAAASIEFLGWKRRHLVGVTVTVAIRSMQFMWDHWILKRIVYQCYSQNLFIRWMKNKTMFLGHTHRNPHSFIKVLKYFLLGFIR